MRLTSSVRGLRPWSARATYALCAVLSAVTIAISAGTQRPLLTQGGLGWDGAQYAQLAAQCGREPMHALEPFVYRIGAPCLAALLPASPRNALLTLNVASSIAILFMLAAWLRQFVAAAIVPWLLAGFAFHWLAPLRYTWWYPTYVDPPAICIVLALLLLRNQAAWFVALCTIGSLIRETTLIVPLSFVIGRALAVTGWGRRFDAALFRDRRMLMALAATVTSTLAIAATHAIVTPDSDYWMLDAAYYWARHKGPFTYLLAWFVAYGPALVLPFIGWRPVREWLATSPEFAVLLAGSALLAWVGGSDTERFLLWSAPLVLVAIGIAASAVDWRAAAAPLVLLIAGQVLNGRWFLSTPVASVDSPHAWPILTPFNAYRFEDLLSQSPDRLTSMMALAEYAALALLLMLWIRRRTA